MKSQRCSICGLTMKGHNRLMRDLLIRIIEETDHDKWCAYHEGEECNCTMLDRHIEEAIKLTQR